MSGVLKDSLQRFLIDGSQVRGELVHLDASWQAMLQRAEYPETVRNVLGEAAVAASLLTSTLKFDGSLIMQIKGNGPLHLLVVQATSQRTLRGLARWQQDVPEGSLRDMCGADKLQITIDQGKERERHQGIVALHGNTLTDSLHHYLSTSDQLPTRLWLAVDEQRAAGMLLQNLPGKTQDDDAWQRSTLIADTIKPQELLQLPAEEILNRLYHEEDVRVFESEPMSFRCGCSQERVKQTLIGLGIDECREILHDEGAINVTCEFCNAHYEFDKVDVEQLYTSINNLSPSDLIH